MYIIPHSLIWECSTISKMFLQQCQSNMQFLFIFLFLLRYPGNLNISLLGTLIPIPYGSCYPFYSVVNLETFPHGIRSSMTSFNWMYFLVLYVGVSSNNQSIMTVYTFSYHDLDIYYLLILLILLRSKL